MSKIEQHITARTLADKLSVEAKTITRLIGDGNCTAVKLGRKYRIPESAAAAYIATRTTKAKQ